MESTSIDYFFGGNLEWLTPACISNYIHYKVGDEITYPFLNSDSGSACSSEAKFSLVRHYALVVLTLLKWESRPKRPANAYQGVILINSI